MRSIPSDKTYAALLDIKDNILAAQGFVAHMSLNAFLESQIHLYAVTRALEIVSEAARRLPEDMRQNHSHLPWRQIMGVGNIYRHEYDTVDAGFVWMTVQAHLTPLLDMVSVELTKYGGAD